MGRVTTNVPRSKIRRAGTLLLTESKVFYLPLVVGAALVVGELEFAERHFLSHPVSSSVRRIGVHVHPVSWRLKQNKKRPFGTYIFSIRHSFNSLK